jgi:hypothetical protein
LVTIHVSARAEDSALTPEANTAIGLKGSQAADNLVSDTNHLAQSNHDIANGQPSNDSTNYHFAKFSAFSIQLISHHHPSCLHLPQLSQRLLLAPKLRRSAPNCRILGSSCLLRADIGPVIQITALRLSQVFHSSYAIESKLNLHY